LGLILRVVMRIIDAISVLLRKKKNEEAGDLPEDGKDPIAESRNWYSDRYESIMVQRNLLLVLTCVMLVTILIGVFMVGQVTLSKSVEPFVIEVEQRSGITNVVNPLSRQDLLTNEALDTYFVMKYLRARETYSVTDYEYNYSTIVRLLSTREVYQQFKKMLVDDPHNPVVVYGNQVQTTLKVRSIQFLEGGKTAQVRFTVVESKGAKYDKIATLSFDFVQMEMAAEERFVNPLGFQVTGYRVDDEIL